MSSGNDYCDGDGDIEDDGYSDGDDNIDGFAHNDFDDDDGDGVLQKRNLDNNKAASLLSISLPNGAQPSQQTLRLGTRASSE